MTKWLLSFALAAFFNVTNAQDQKDIKHVNIKQDCCCPDPAGGCLTTAEANSATHYVHTPKEVIFDFRTKQLAFPNGVNAMGRRSVFRIRVVNYNPYLYKLLIDDKDSSVSAAVDGKLLFWFIDPANLSGIVANLVQKVGDVPLSDPKPNVEKIKTLPADVSMRKVLMSEGYNIEDSRVVPARRGAETIALETAESILQAQAVVLKSEQQAFDALNNEISAFQLKVAGYFQAQRKLFPECADFSKWATKENLDKLKSELDGLKQRASQLKNQFREDHMKYQIAISKYRKQVDENQNLKEGDAIVTSFYKAADTALGEAATALSTKTFADLKARLEAMAQTYTCYTSAEIFMKERAKSVSIEFKPRYDTLVIEPYKTSFTLPFIQQRVFGISGGIHYSSPSNRSYSNRAVLGTQPGDTLYQLTENGLGAGQLGINSLAYVGWKANPNNDKPNYWGLSFGAGLSIESKPKPRVLLGGSFITGEENRLLLSAGLIAGQVTRLSSAFDTTTPYTRPATDVVVDRLKLGLFVSVNYSFLNR